MIIRLLSLNHRLHNFLFFIFEFIKGFLYKMTNFVVNLKFITQGINTV